MSHRSGFVAIVGRPNVGKSTLLNRLVGTKVAIVSPKPQTTRRRILGVTTLPDAQLLFYDTAGWHRARSVMNKRMVQDTEGVIDDADVVLWVVDAMSGLRDDDRFLCDRLRARNRPVCIALNKIDRRARAKLLPQLAQISALLPEAEIVPISALSGDNVPKLIDILAALLPEGPRLYDEDTITDQTERMLVEEIIREQIFLQMREEVPYAVGVVIEKFEDRDDLSVVAAAIHVERSTQKGIVIGAGGARIKEIGRAARLEAEDVLGRRVYLELFVRVDEDWTTDPRRLAEMGF